MLKGPYILRGILPMAVQELLPKVGHFEAPRYPKVLVMASRPENQVVRQGGPDAFSGS